MTRRLRVSALLAVLLMLPLAVSAQLPDAPARIVLIVDSSSSIAPWLTDIRAGLNAFLDELPAGPDEVVLISTGGQLRIRVQPTTDREKLREAASGFFADGGANSFLDSMLESDKRFLKNTPTEWPVFVMLTTDSGQTRDEPNIDSFNKFMRDFIARRGSAHAIVIQGRNTGITSDIAKHLAENTGGVYETMGLATSLPDKMREIAVRIARDHHPKLVF